MVIFGFLYLPFFLFFFRREETADLVVLFFLVTVLKCTVLLWLVPLVLPMALSWVYCPKYFQHIVWEICILPKNSWFHTPYMFFSVDASIWWYVFYLVLSRASLIGLFGKVGNPPLLFLILSARFAYDYLFFLNIVFLCKSVQKFPYDQTSWWSTLMTPTQSQSLVGRIILPSVGYDM